MGMGLVQETRDWLEWVNVARFWQQGGHRDGFCKKNPEVVPC